jgi:ubiquinol-cytochrome c reductase iron-sulfur subunit
MQPAHAHAGSHGSHGAGSHGGGAHGAGNGSGGSGPDGTRRDFLYLATGATAAFGLVATVWPLISNLSPAADVLALSSIEFDLAPVQEGQRVTVAWRGSPVFVDHRTAKQIEEARAVEVASLPDPQTDEARVKKPEWLIMIGICTHLGCVPLGQKAGDPVGDYGGWFCPCHGSQYDTSGRIRKGPAPRNLDIPPYEFIADNKVRIG